MPRFSAFTPFGQLAFSTRKPHGQLFYEEQVKALGNGANYSDDFGSLASARLYANAMAYGSCRYALERGPSQVSPAKALELLPTLEREYGLIPEPNATLATRRSELAAAAIIARGAMRDNVEIVLRKLLGDALVSYTTVSADEAVMSTTAPTTVGIYELPGSPRTAFALSSAVSQTGIDITVQATLLAGVASAPRPGQSIIVDPGDYGRAEAVTVTSASLSGSTLTLTAAFANAHVAGTLIATGRHPNIATSKRHNVFLMTANSVRDNRSRRRLNRAASRLLRAVSTWSMTDASGPFKVGEGKLDVTTIGEVA